MLPTTPKWFLPRDESETAVAVRSQIAHPASAAWTQDYNLREIRFGIRTQAGSERRWLLYDGKCVTAGNAAFKRATAKNDLVLSYLGVQFADGTTFEAFQPRTAPLE